ncbi:CGNR zinc finger domain-containing protein [Actinomycetospora endophytica]|uniref:CGNR zinc finger domain-containing protein n=1 Tax=Actinomycetospora endophytica TaxID=2291215 RepID=A0ABS8PEZ1_9PSEU|nr:CGNR zinc finger domain-containing protein [Actinomycetospora endophytica]MCD2196832.1 CGNR zinc finger domain-containing protein [Actinomycetospora endophytica]
MARDWGAADFVGGHVALDVTNTVGGFRRERVERIATYADLLAWARTAEVVDDEEAGALTALAEVSPDKAEAALHDVRNFREALHRWLAAAVSETAPDDPDRVRVAHDVAEAFRDARLAPDPTSGPAWLLTVDDVGLALPARRLALATAALLASDDRHRIGLCGRCSWLFLDPSPSRRRRWCSMATCGNRAKAARHHARSSG